MIAVCGILKQKGKVLLCKRVPWSNFGGYWEIPTFEYNEEETLEDSLERGYFERLTLKVEKIRYLNTQNLRIFKNLHLWVYEIEKIKGNPFLSGYTTWRFVKQDSLNRYRIIPGYENLLKNLMRTN